MIAGPLPRMLTDAVARVSRAMRTSIRFGDDGHGRNVHEHPLVAVRELIANALVHRDLSEPALSKGIEIRLLRDRLIIPNPGGLWGLSVDQLGTRDGKSAVNEYLYNVCTFATNGEGRRVIEGLGSGIREVRRALLSPRDLEWLSGLDVRGLSVAQRHALVEMRHGKSWTNSSYRRRFGVDSEQARRRLQELVGRGHAAVSGRRGAASYSLAVALPRPDATPAVPDEVAPCPRTPPPSAHRPVSVHPSNLTAAIRPPLDRVG